MADKVSVPFSDQDVDVTDPTDVVTTVVSLMVGAVVLLVALGGAQDIKDWIVDQISNLIGSDVAGGEVGIGTNGGGL